MITAHLPAGYLTGRAFSVSGVVVMAGIIGGILPDVDLFWFYFVDNRAFHHHHYWVHIPAIWGGIAALSLPVIFFTQRGLLKAAVSFFSAILGHLLLDTVAGDIKWLWPFSDQFYHVFNVPAQYDNWVLNFILHPVFLIEILIWSIAIMLWCRPRP